MALIFYTNYWSKFLNSYILSPGLTNKIWAINYSNWINLQLNNTNNMEVEIENAEVNKLETSETKVEAIDVSKLNIYLS